MAVWLCRARSSACGFRLSVVGFQFFGSSPSLALDLGRPGRGAATDVALGSDDENPSTLKERPMRAIGAQARFKMNRPAIIAKNKNNVFAKTIEGPVGKSY
jgi:hypothetical protein